MTRFTYSDQGLMLDFDQGFGAKYRIPVQVVKHTNDGRVRHRLDECGRFSKENDLLGFILVDFDDVPLEWKFRALLTNVPSSEISGLLSLVSRSSMALDCTIDSEAVIDLCGSLLPDSVWLGVTLHDFNRRARDIYPNYEPIPDWGLGIEIVESNQFSHTFRYAPEREDFACELEANALYLAVHHVTNEKTVN